MDFDKEYKKLFQPVMDFTNKYNEVTQYMCQYVYNITYVRGVCCMRASLPAKLSFIDFNKDNPSQKEWVKEQIEDIKQQLNKKSDILLHFEIKHNRRRVIELLIEKFNLKLIKFVDYRHMDFYFTIKHEAFDNLYTLLKLTNKI